jgi:hypothetical protein
VSRHTGALPRAHRSGRASPARCSAPLPGRLYVTLVVSLVAALPVPALARLYSCQEGEGRIILRDVPCKRSETSRDARTPSKPLKAQAASARTSRAGERITADAMQQLVAGWDAAIAQLDVAAVLNYLAADAVLEVEYRLVHGLQLKRFDKEQYAAYLRASLKSGNGYDYKRKDASISISADQRYAELTGTVRETVWIEGSWRAGVTRSKAIVEMRDGRPQIALVRAATAFETPPVPYRPRKGRSRPSTPDPAR